MTISFDSLLLYAGAMAVLWVAPGPVWVALMARGALGWVRGRLAVGGRGGAW